MRFVFIMTIVTIVASVSFGSTTKKNRNKYKEEYRKAKIECLKENSSLKGKPLQKCIKSKI